jgi:hypothetical protein
VATGSKAAVAEVRMSLQGVSEWFDEYMAQEEVSGGQVRFCAVVATVASCIVSFSVFVY